MVRGYLGYPSARSGWWGVPHVWMVGGTPGLDGGGTPGLDGEGVGGYPRSG